MPESGRKMSGAVAFQIGGRVSAWLRQAYPHDATKMLARDFGCSPHTTRRWLEGDPPSNGHLGAMAAKWGKAFVQFVYEPLTGPWGEVDACADALRILRDNLDRWEEAVERDRRTSVVGIGTGDNLARQPSLPPRLVARSVAQEAHPQRRGVK